MKIKTICDMGSIKIFSDEVSLFFSNDYGDGENIVHLIEKEKDNCSNYKFLGHFSVKEDKSVFLSSYDCSDDGVCCFEKGRYFVYLKKPMEFVIQKQDMDIYS